MPAHPATALDRPYFQTLVAASDDNTDVCESAQLMLTGSVSPARLDQDRRLFLDVIGFQAEND